MALELEFLSKDILVNEVGDNLVADVTAGIKDGTTGVVFVENVFSAKSNKLRYDSGDVLFDIIKVQAENWRDGLVKTIAPSTATVGNVLVQLTSGLQAIKTPITT